MVAVQYKDGHGFTADEVKTECLHFYAATYAPVQAAACDLVIALSLHPEVRERARAAARAGDDVYLDQVAREVWRFCPIVPSTLFARVKEDCEFGGYRLPKGWKATASLHTSMRDASTFEQPGDFDPDRFAPAQGILDRRPMGYLPHGAGPLDGHRCAGEPLADLILRSFAVALLREHTWDLPPQGLTLQPAGLTPLPADGLRIVFKRA